MNRFDTIEKIKTFIGDNYKHKYYEHILWAYQKGYLSDEGIEWIKNELERVNKKC